MFMDSFAVVVPGAVVSDSYLADWFNLRACHQEEVFKSS
jgi:hypothetical protein